MGKYRCNNKDCKQHGELVTATTHIIYERGKEDIDKGAPCPKCGKIREMVFEGTYARTLARGNPNICTK